MSRKHGFIFATTLLSTLALVDMAYATEPVPIDEASERPAAVPIVPLPSAVYGSMASVGLMIALRYSKHRRWVTLR